MIRTAILTLAIAAAAAVPARAQSAAKPAADSTIEQLVGAWEGQLQSEHGPGAMTMTIAHADAWKATIDMMLGDMAITSRVSDFKVDGNNLSWTADLMGMTCKGTAVLAAGTLRGETACEQGAVSYLLKKKKA